MKKFLTHLHSITQCQKELNELKELLAYNSELDEKRGILPFFRARPHLSAFISTYASDIINPDRLAFEFDLFGDFVCDLAVGDSKNHTFLLVEFEDAKKNSLFQPNARYAPDWSHRLEHGFSQIIDWFWKLEDVEGSSDYEHRFGARKATFHGLLIIGRTEQLREIERKRLKWRHDHVIVDSQKVTIISFDQLAETLEIRLNRYFEAAKQDN